MRVERCSFCSGNIYPGHGTTFVRNDGKIFNFCTSKCRRNYNLKRNPRKVRWTKAYRRLHGKDLTVDSTFDFERRRNRPVRYNRDLYERCVAAMKRVYEIRAQREIRHMLMRKQAHAEHYLEVHAEDAARIAPLEGQEVARREVSLPMPSRETIAALQAAAVDLSVTPQERAQAVVRLRVLEKRVGEKLVPEKLKITE